MNTIHQTAIIGPNVQMGDGNFIGPYCVIQGRTRIGDGNRFEAYCSIGQPAEHRSHFSSQYGGLVVIGNENVIREFTTINSPTMGETRMGSRCVMLRGSHLSHDSVLEDDVTVSCGVLIGGESYIMRGSNLGLGAILHQRTVVGPYAMVGMGTIVTRKSQIQPGGIYAGSPARFLRLNTLGLERASVDQKKLEDFYTLYFLKYDNQAKASK